MGELIVFQWGWTCSFVYILELYPSYIPVPVGIPWLAIAVRFGPRSLHAGVVLQEGVKVTIVMGHSNNMGTQEECFVHWTLVITKVLLHISGI